LQGEVELRSGGCKNLRPSLIWIKAVSIEDGNCEKVTTRMQPTDLAGFAAANDLVGKSDVEVREAIGDKFPKHHLPPGRSFSRAGSAGQRSV